MEGYITISELARESGLTIPHICMLVKRGIIPNARKDGRATYLPEAEARLAVMGRKQTGHRGKRQVVSNFDGWAI